jgi:hypothetical protein
MVSRACYQGKMLNRPLDWLRNLAAGVAVMTASIALVWYFATLEGRVKSIEAQMQVLRTAPTISSPVGETQNPLAQACAKLASDFVDTLKSIGYTRSRDADNAAVAIKQLMADLKCAPTKQSN